MSIIVTDLLSIRGQYVTLEILQEKHLAGQCEFLNHIPTMQALIPFFKRETWSENDVRERIQKFDESRLNGSGLHFSILKTKDLSTLGSIGFKNIDHQKKEAEFGIIVHKNFWGSIPVLEAIILAIDFIFDHHSLDKLYAHTDESNIRSNSILNRLGISRSDSNPTELKFEITRHEWSKVKDQLNFKRGQESIPKPKA